MRISVGVGCYVNLGPGGRSLAQSHSAADRYLLFPAHAISPTAGFFHLSMAPPDEFRPGRGAPAPMVSPAIGGADRGGHISIEICISPVTVAATANHMMILCNLLFCFWS